MCKNDGYNEKKVNYMVTFDSLSGWCYNVGR